MCVLCARVKKQKKTKNGAILARFLKKTASRAQQTYSIILQPKSVVIHIYVHQSSLKRIKLDQLKKVETFQKRIRRWERMYSKLYNDTLY